MTNTITDDGLDHLVAALFSTTYDGAIKYVAIGDDNTTPTTSDTTLGSEQFRKAVTDQTLGAVGTLDTVVQYSPSEGNFTIEEIGWFAGASATSASDSGTMISRILYSKTKTSEESLQIDRRDILS